MKPVSLDEAVWAISLVPKFLPGPEPIGPLDYRAHEKLEGALYQPFASYDGKYAYWFLYHRAAMLFYFVIKDHCMENGNKRSAVIITMYFLYKNGKTFNLNADELYELACHTAESVPSLMDVHIHELKAKFKHHIVDLD